VKKYKIDKVFSLQNTIIKKINIPQVLYLHQSLPFCEFKFPFYANMKLWIYQNIIGKEIYKSIQRAQHVIVQTNWMKKACIIKTNIKSCNVSVAQPHLDFICHQKYLITKESTKTFFYPAAFMEYKNHKIIVEACVRLQQRGIKDYKVVFTLAGNETKKIKMLLKKIQAMQLNIEFVGRMTKEQVYEMYTKSILLFPSYIETFGLPMLECKMCNGVIIASDYAFSHEILDGYPNAYFFNPFNALQLANLMQKFINNEFENNYKNCQKEGVDKVKSNSWDKVIRIILNSSEEDCI
jgi:glycosyltransferase involved in cell wall biosynthesis